MNKLLKRSITVLLSISLLLSCVLFNTSVMAASSDTLSVEAESKAVNVGESFTVNINITNNPGITMLKLCVEYDAEVVTLTNVTDNAILNNGVLDNVLGSPFEIVWLDAEAKVNNTATGSVATLTFTSNASLSHGATTKIKVSLVDTDDCLDKDLNAVDFSATDGTITFINISDLAPGDVNRDAATDSNDVIFLMYNLLYPDNEDYIIYQDTDYDISGAVDRKDVLRLMYYAIFNHELFIPAGDTFEENGVTYNREYASNIELFKYCGTWQADLSNTKSMVGYWTYKSVEIDFTGTSIVLEFSKPSKFSVSVDGGASKTYTDTEGKVTVTATGNGKHTLKIYDSYLEKRVYFLSAAVPEGETMSRTADKEQYIQFIGDSISQDGRSFTFNVGPKNNWDYSVTAKAGISLRNGKGYVNVDYLNSDEKLVGMEDAFFRLGYPSTHLSDEEKLIYADYFTNEDLLYKFKTGNTPDIVFIFIGTNDGLTSTDYAADFAEHYVNFVDNIMEAYDNKPQIVMMQSLHAVYEARYECIETAAEAVIAKYPDKAQFIDKATVDSWNVEISSDNTHPSAAGYARISETLAAWLDERF